MVQQPSTEAVSRVVGCDDIGMEGRAALNNLEGNERSLTTQKIAYTHRVLRQLLSIPMECTM